jgi:hypothetical protein
MLIIGCDFHTRYQQIAMGGWRILNTPGRFRVAYPLRFCSMQRVGNSLLRFAQRMRPLGRHLP